jgi:hypothetical protein
MGSNILADNDSPLDSKDPNDENSVLYKGDVLGNNGVLDKQGVIKAENIQDQIIILNLEGAFFDEKEIKYVSRQHAYTYYATLNKEITKEEIKKIKWAAVYDNNPINSFSYLLSGGSIENRKLKVDIQVSQGINSFKIYAYTGDFPTKDSPYTEAQYKKSITFFIGGAGDKHKFAGEGPTNIILEEALQPFAQKVGMTNLFNPSDIQLAEKNVYLGYNEIFKTDAINKNILPHLRSEGISVNIVGHSLGGWNGAHLSKILSDKGYNVDLLITLDPVGTGYAIRLFSDIYDDYPTPRYKYWINIQTDPDLYKKDDYISWLGGQWKPDKRSPTDYIVVPYHHSEVLKMFTYPITDDYTAKDFLLTFTARYLNSK